MAIGARRNLAKSVTVEWQSRCASAHCGVLGTLTSRSQGGLAERYFAPRQREAVRQAPLDYCQFAAITGNKFA